MGAWGYSMDCLRVLDMPGAGPRLLSCALGSARAVALRWASLGLLCCAPGWPRASPGRSQPKKQI